MARAVLFLCLIVAGFVAGYGYGRWYGPRPAGEASAKKAQAQRYHCPMHPTYISDKPGDCPICGMRLVPIRTEEEHEAAVEHARERKILHYRDPHDPSYTSDKPGLNPATGNELEPVYADDPSTMPMGTIRVSPEKQQLIGVRYGTADYTAGVHSFRAVGKVAFDETRIARVQTKIEGWIDEVYVDFVGKLIKQGQPLLTLYSPEMLATQEEFLLALRSQDIMKSSPLAGSLQQAGSLVAAARRRLELWDLSEAQIDEIARTGKTIRNIRLYSPIGGYVMTRNAFPKQRITPETELYTIVDLSKVWIMAEVFESEAPMVRLGMPASVTLPYAGGRRLSAKVDYIQPQIEAMTRTLMVRLEADNAGMVLKPDMFVDVDFRVAMARRLTVPSEAVLDSGLRQTVFVDRGNGYLEPRQVETGERIGDRIEIVKGLRAGERVVTSGNFLIDSESQLKSAAAGMAGHQHGAPGREESRPPAGEHPHD
jgi:RND family efflux transporter MFP subunit